ncbi:Uncharacterised protein [Leclercia adecarboxylata]|uniref:Uncharacterized protein n=1 Tax=Leclercia adecarboxylata TaxID=83655 RepID=A0A4V6JIB4_9ENTR|nr:Uncharacterised protein [Leclercia adecarboxylata]
MTVAEICFDTHSDDGIKVCFNTYSDGLVRLKIA